MKRNTLASIGAALALMGPLAALAQSPATVTWKWKDASGQVVVSDRPPPSSVPDKDILVRPAVAARAPAPVPAAAGNGGVATAAAGNPKPVGVDPEIEARRKKAADEQTAQQRAAEEKNAAVRADNCSRARSHLAALSEGMRIARTNERGEREILDDKGRAEEMQRARGVIASDCGK